MGNFDGTCGFLGLQLHLYLLGAHLEEFVSDKWHTQLSSDQFTMAMIAIGWRQTRRKPSCRRRIREKSRCPSSCRLARSSIWRSVVAKPSATSVASWWRKRTSSRATRSLRMWHCPWKEHDHTSQNLPVWWVKYCELSNSSRRKHPKRLALMIMPMMLPSRTTSQTSRTTSTKRKPRRLMQTCCPDCIDFGPKSMSSPIFQNQNRPAQTALFSLFFLPSMLFYVIFFLFFLVIPCFLSRWDQMLSQLHRDYKKLW